MPLPFGAAGHLFGTDSIGRDMLARLAYGGRTTLEFTFISNVTSIGLGAVVGVTAGFLRGKAEIVLMRITEIFLSVPTVISGLALASVVGEGVFGVIVVVTALYWAWTARVVFGETLALRRRAFVEAAIAQGVPSATIMRRHIVPHLSSLLLVIAALNGAAVVAIGAGLSYLGAGVQPPTAEWGAMINDGQNALAVRAPRGHRAADLHRAHGARVCSHRRRHRPSRICLAAEIMARYLATRIGLGVLTVFGVVLLTFVLMFVVPGDPARTIAGPRATPQILALVRANLHLNQPVLAQLGDYLVGIVHGDLGVSYVQDQPVAQLIVDRLPATIELGLSGLVLELILGGAFGVWDGMRARRSRILAVVNVGFLSVPAFSLAFVLLLLFGYKLSLFPIDGGTGGTRIVLPALTLGLFGMPYYANVVRDAMQETLAAPYTRTAVAEGLPRRVVLRRHVLRNAFSPALTMAGLDFAILLSGVVFVETVFGWPGIGQLQTQAFYNVDRPVLMGTVVVAAVLVVAGDAGHRPDPHGRRPAHPAGVAMSVVSAPGRARQCPD